MTTQLLAQIKNCFRYEAETGKIFWKFCHHKKLIGQEAGTIEKRGRKLYKRVYIQGTKLYVHHIVWAFETGVLPTLIDHKDGDGLNNIFSNLQDTTQLVNIRKADFSNRSSSGIPCVNRLPSGRYMVRVYGRYLGSFTTKEEAAKVAEAAR